MEIVISFALGIYSAIYLNRHKDKPPSVAFYALMILLAFWPVLGNFGLYFLALEYQHLFGVWPEPMVNDPKHAYGQGHQTYDAIYDIVDVLYGFAICWMILFFTLFCTNWTRLSKIWRITLSAICFATIAAFIWDFGALFTWMLD